MKVDHIDLWVSFLGSKVIAHSYFSIRRANGEWPGWEQAFYMGNWGFWKNPELTSAYLSQRNFEINKRSTVIHCVLDSLPTCDKGLWLVDCMLPVSPRGLKVSLWWIAKHSWHALPLCSAFCCSICPFPSNSHLYIPSSWFHILK